MAKPSSGPPPRGANDAPSRLASRYELLEPLGRGGAGTVFRVHDALAGEARALKLLEAGTAADRLRFRHEFHQLARLRHPRVVRAFDFGVDGSRLFYTMELLEPLRVGEGAPAREVAATCALLRDVASALAFLHARRLVHRDVSAGNVGIGADGRARLADFGVLASFGASAEVAGTPPYLAPEALRGRPLDHRTDLYGLGALAYWLLTGRHAYPAREFEQLEPLWTSPPAPPSHLAAGIAPELDALVLALLALAPEARPTSAAEVIDRLGAIAHLPPVPEADVARGYLASAPLVGRRRELEVLAAHVARLAAPGGADVTGKTARAAATAPESVTESAPERAIETVRGGVVVLEAPSGAGKTRLLSEAALEAQLAGAAVAHARGGAAAGTAPFGVLRELLRGLVRVDRELVARAARSDAARLGWALPELRPLLATGGSATEPAAAPAAGGEPQSERAGLQRALAGFLVALARERPTVLLVDDVQRADEASLAALAGAASQSAHVPLLIVAGQRTDDGASDDGAAAAAVGPERAPPALRALRDRATVLPLGDLDDAALGVLVRGLFGELRDARSVVSWLEQHGLTRPIHVLDRLGELVATEVLRYERGIWLLAARLPPVSPASSVVASTARTLADLPPRARHLAEALAVLGRDATLAECTALCEPDDPAADRFVELDLLVERGLLVSDGARWRIRHDSVREALLAGIDEPARAAHHRRIAEVLRAAGPVAEDREQELGWHLLRGGDRAGGAALLEAAGRRLLAAYSFADAIPPLEAALAVRRAGVGTVRSRVEVGYLLLFASSASQMSISVAHGPEVVADLLRYSGVDIALRLGRYAGRLLALLVGLLVATTRWLVTPPRRRGPTPIAALRDLVPAAMALVGVYLQLGMGERIAPMVAILRALAPSRRQLPYAVYLHATVLRNLGVGAPVDIEARVGRVLEIVRVGPNRLFPEQHLRILESMAHQILAFHALNEQRMADHDASLARIEQLAVPLFEPHVLEQRLLALRSRGEEPQAEALEREADLRFVQLGGAHQAQWLRPVFALGAYALTENVVGLRRCIADLERMRPLAPTFAPVIEMARGEYERVRGDARAAVAHLARSLEDEGVFRSTRRVYGLAALAEAQLAAGEPAAALATAAETAALLAVPSAESMLLCARVARTRALALAAQGELAAAAREVDAALRRVEPSDNPLLIAALHEAGARVAARAGDDAAFALHRLGAERHFARTGNPALAGRAERLEAERRSLARASNVPAAAGAADPPSADVVETKMIRRRRRREDDDDDDVR